MSDLRMTAVVKEQKIQTEWERHFRRWDRLYYVLGISTVVLSALIAAKPFDFGDPFYRSVACLMTISTGLFAS